MHGVNREQQEHLKLPAKISQHCTWFTLRLPHSTPACFCLSHLGIRWRGPWLGYEDPDEDASHLDV